MKKDPFTIMQEILKALETGEAFSINQLSQETGMHNITIKKYVKIIEMVKEEPRVEVIKTRHSIILRMKKRR